MLPRVEDGVGEPGSLASEPVYDDTADECCTKALFDPFSLSLSGTGSPFSCSSLLPSASEDLTQCLERSPTQSLPLNKCTGGADQKPAGCLSDTALVM